MLRVILKYTREDNVFVEQLKVNFATNMKNKDK